MILVMSVDAQKTWLEKAKRHLHLVLIVRAAPERAPG